MLTPLEIVHLLCFKIMQRNPTLTSKFVHENPTTTVDWNALKTTLFIGLES